MKPIRRAALFAALVCLLPPPALAQTAAPTYLEGNQVKPAGATFVVDKNGTPIGTSTNPFSFNCIAGCSSGGGGTGGPVTQSGTWAFVLANGGNSASVDSAGHLYTLDGNSAAQLSALNSAVTALNSAVTKLTALAASLSAPINPATSNGTLIGAVQGIGLAGTPDPYVLTVQGITSGVPFTVLSGANSSGAVALEVRDTTVGINISTATTTQLVAAVTGKSIRITGGLLIAAAAENVTLEWGTGTNCGTGTTTIGGALPLAANSGFSIAQGGGPIGPSGYALCVVTSAAVQLSGWFNDTQY